MKILIINLLLHSSEHGVITRRKTNDHTMIYTLARGFRKLGHDVTLLASEEYRPLEAESPGFEVVYFPSFMPSVCSPVLLPWPKGMRRWLRRNRDGYDLVISSEVFSLASLAASKICSGKLLIWHEMSSFQRMLYGIPAKFWYNFPARMLMSRTPVAARSEEARRFVSGFMPLTSNIIVSHGADEDIFVPSEERKKSFVSVSQLIKRKRVDRLMRRFAEFVRIPGMEDFRLEIVGDGPEKDNLRRLAEELGIDSSVVFHGFRFHAEWAGIAAGAAAMLIDTEQDLNMVTVSESIVNGTPLLMNTLPATAGYVSENGLGIAKDDWGAEDMERMVENYDEFHRNCINVRGTLTNTGTARLLLRVAAENGIIRL